jgi:hypothetical protein
MGKPKKPKKPTPPRIFRTDLDPETFGSAIRQVRRRRQREQFSVSRENMRVDTEES